MKRKKSTKIKNIIFKFIKGCPLMTMMVISVVVLDLSAVIVNLSKGEELKVTVDRPMFASIIAPQTTKGEDIGDDLVLENDATNQSGDTENQTNVAQENGGDSGEQTLPKPAEVVYSKVKKDYFDDALFIGDSRVEGLKLYSGLDNATYYCKEGVSLTKLMKDKFVKMKIKGKKEEVSITKALKKKKFAKIYLMVGINEVGYRDTDEFKNIYKGVVDKIKELQPDAKIIVLGMMNVTKDYSKQHPSFSNKNISKKNKAIASLADNVNVFYLDFNSEICDSKGNVKKKYTWDGVHLKAEYYSIWVDFMKKHGI